MRASSYIVVCTMAVLVLLLVEAAEVSGAVTCSPTELAPCANAIMSSSPPSKLCCTKINQQKPCLCQYLKNPKLKNLVNSPNSKKVASTCGVPIPKC